MSAFIKRLLKHTRRFDRVWSEACNTGVIEVAKLRAAQAAGKLDRSEKTTQET